MSAINFVRIMVCSLAVVAAVQEVDVEAAENDAANRFNVLFIAIDDLRPELGCYGSKAAQSPHLDRLARRSVLFDRHYVQVATCGASRFALLTGRSPASSGVTSNNGALYSGSTALKQEQQPGAQSMPELFRRSGYRTVCLGKISHTPDGRVFAYNGKGDGRPEVPHAWDELPTPFGAWKRGWGIFFAYEGGRHREDGNGHKDLMEFTAENDDDLPDGQIASTAIEQLRQLRDSQQRFFLGVGFFKPHLPFVATRKDWEAVADAEFALENPQKIDSPYWHGSGEFFKYNAPYQKDRPLKPDAALMARRAYLACVRYVDRQVGRVVDTLEELGLADNTIIVVWGDHGWHLGEQQLWAKHNPFERANRSVLMVRAPGVSTDGLKTSALVETTDLYPTLVDLCQPSFSRTHFPLDGVSLRPILTGQRQSIRDTAISYWRDAVSVRSDTHRLVTKFKGGRIVHQELYDLREGPDSVENVASSQTDVAQRLSALITRGK